jgi:hypothetical protein
MGRDSSGASSTVISVVSGEGQRLGQKLAEMLKRSRCPGANRVSCGQQREINVDGSARSESLGMFMTRMMSEVEQTDCDQP